MKKIVNFVSIILVIIALSLGVYAAFRILRAKHHAQLVSYQTSYGGDMTGSSRRTKIKKLDDETALVTWVDSDWVFRDPDVTEYAVPIEYLQKVEEIYDRYRLYTLGDLPQSPMIALDAGSTDYSFYFEDRESVSFDTYEIVPRRGYAAAEKITEVLLEGMQHGQRLPGLVLPVRGEDDPVELPGDADGRLSIRVYEYSENELHYRIHNGTPEDAQLPGPVEVYRLDGEDRILIAQDETYDGIFRVYRAHFSDGTVHPDERLIEGLYQICLSGISSEFRIGVPEDQ